MVSQLCIPVPNRHEIFTRLSGCAGAARSPPCKLVGLRLTSLALVVFWTVKWLQWLETGLYLYICDGARIALPRCRYIDGTHRLRNSASSKRSSSSKARLSSLRTGLVDMLMDELQVLSKNGGPARDSVLSEPLGPCRPAPSSFLLHTTPAFSSCVTSTHIFRRRSNSHR